MEKLYTTKETCEALNVTMPTLRRWIKEERIPITRLVRIIMFKESTLNKIIEEGLESVKPK